MTSLMLFVPLWALVTRRALHDGLLTRRSLVGTAGVGGAIHAVAVAQQVFYLRPRLPGRRIS